MRGIQIAWSIPIMRTSVGKYTWPAQPFALLWCTLLWCISSCTAAESFEADSARMRVEGADEMAQRAFELAEIYCKQTTCKLAVLAALRKNPTAEDWLFDRALKNEYEAVNKWIPAMLLADKTRPAFRFIYETEVNYTTIEQVMGNLQAQARNSIAIGTLLSALTNGQSLLPWFTVEIPEMLTRYSKVAHSWPLGNPIPWLLEKQLIENTPERIELLEHILRAFITARHISGKKIEKDELIANKMAEFQSPHHIWVGEALIEASDLARTYWDGEPLVPIDFSGTCSERIQQRRSWLERTDLAQEYSQYLKDLLIVCADPIRNREQAVVPGAFQTLFWRAAVGAAKAQIGSDNAYFYVVNVGDIPIQFRAGRRGKIRLRSTRRPANDLDWPPNEEGTFLDNNRQSWDTTPIEIPPIWPLLKTYANDVLIETDLNDPENLQLSLFTKAESSENIRKSILQKQKSYLSYLGAIAIEASSSVEDLESTYLWHNFSSPHSLVNSDAEFRGLLKPLRHDYTYFYLEADSSSSELSTTSSGYLIWPAKEEDFEKWGPTPFP